MTPKESIEVLRKNKPTSDPRECAKELCEACDMAIEALRVIDNVNYVATEDVINRRWNITITAEDIYRLSEDAILYLIVEKMKMQNRQ